MSKKDNFIFGTIFRQARLPINEVNVKQIKEANGQAYHACVGEVLRSFEFEHGSFIFSDRHSKIRQTFRVRTSGQESLTELIWPICA